MLSASGPSRDQTNSELIPASPAPGVRGRYLREALNVLAALAPSLEQAVQAAAQKAYVILDGTLLRTDRVVMASGSDRAYYLGKYKAHGLNVQVIADQSAGGSGPRPRCPAPGTTLAPPANAPSHRPWPRQT